MREPSGDSSAPRASRPPAEPRPSGVAEKDRRRLARGAVINLLGALGKFLSPAYLVLANQIYGADVFGLYALTIAPMEILTNFVVTGFKDAVERYAARDPDSGGPSDAVYAMIARCLRWVMGMSLVAVVLLLVLGRPLVIHAWGRPELAPVLLLLAANIPLVGATILLLAATRALMVMHPEVIVASFTIPAVMVGGAIGFHLVRPDVYGLVLAFSLANLVGVVLAAAWFTRYYSLRRLWAARRLPTEPGLLAFAIPQSFNMMLTLAMWNLDLMMLGGFVGNAAIGFYRTASEIARSVFQVRFVFSSVYSPLVARYSREGNLRGMQESFVQLSRWILAAAAPVAALVYLYRSEILWLFNPDYYQDAAFLWLLLVGPLFSAATGLTGNILVMTGHSVYNLLNGILLTAVNAVLNALLIPDYGLTGAAVATMVASVGVGILQIVEVRRLVGIRVEPLALLRPLGATAVALTAALSLRSLLAPWPVPSLVAQGLALAGLYALFMLAPVGRRFRLGDRPVA